MLPSSEMGLTLQTIVSACLLRDGPDVTNNCHVDTPKVSDDICQYAHKLFQSVNDFFFCRRTRSSSVWALAATRVAAA